MTDRIFGVIERSNHTSLLNPVERGLRPFVLSNDKGLKNGDFVEVEPHRREFVLIKNYGPCNLNAINEILITKKYNIPNIFSDKILKECKKFADFEETPRTNLTKLPFVTIDGDDSKDFDDAVYAKRTAEGFEIIVAIADVAFYVRPGSALDREAYKRGNSVYLPQTVVPMLPEILSNDLCSLNPGVKRPVIACFMSIDKKGKMLSYRFERATIKSTARLTYKEVEAAINGKFNDNTKKHFTTSIQPVYAAYFALEHARKARGTLEIEANEVKIKFDKKGNVIAIEKEKNLTSHKIIEEFMIAANVAAAKLLGKYKFPVMYRIHDKPLEEKLKELKPVLSTFKLKLPDYAAIKPVHLNKILEARTLSPGMDDLVLRLQCQAKYSPHNIGHFGLNLPEYAHFTSPIRRYSDLLIHRALLYALKMEKNAEAPAKMKVMEETGDHLCQTERRAINAEREITARYVSLYMKPLVGAKFEVKISGFSSAGIFVRLEQFAAEGLIPMRTLPYDHYLLINSNNMLKGKNTKLQLRLGETLTAVLTEATPLTGGLIFAYIPNKPLPKTKTKTKKGKRKT